MVPALTINFEPSATVTSPCRFIVPVQVSVPVIVPTVVSLTAEAVGKVTKPARLVNKRRATSDRLFWDVYSDIIGTDHLIPLT